MPNPKKSQHTSAIPHTCTQSSLPHTSSDNFRYSFLFVGLGCLEVAWSVLIVFIFGQQSQAKKTTKIMKKTISIRKIFIISQRFDVTDWKYFRISECAASTFSCVSSTFPSILRKDTNGIRQAKRSGPCQRSIGGIFSLSWFCRPLPLYSFLLLLYHVRQLLEDGAQFNYCGFYVLHSVCAALNV